MSSLTKKCSKCDIEKNVDNFHINRRSKDGRDYQCKKCINDRVRERYKEDEEVRKKYADRFKRWKQKNPEKYQECAKASEKKRSRTEARTKYNREYMKNRRKDPVHHIKHNVSRQVVHGLKRNLGSKHGQPVFDALGYSPQDLKEHLERQFDDKMNWENYGTYWHIDHIIPHSSYDYSCLESEEFKKCWSLENLRPLEAIENIKKGAKLPM